MRKNKDKKSSSKNSAGFKFSNGLCAFFLGLCRFLAPFFGARITKSKAFRQQKKQGAMLVVANHLSAFDFIYFCAPFVGAKLNFVVAQNMMYSTPIFATLIKKYNAITKKQFYADFQCVKNIKKCLDSGISVLVCPEGKVSADGKTGVISPAIARLIGWLGYPVGVIKMSGASFIRPKWAGNLRLGRVDVECDVLLDAQQSKSLSKEEIYERVCLALEHNEHKWQADNGCKYLGAHYARGLSRLLYQCPRCGSDLDMTSTNEAIVCKRCSNTVLYKRDGSLVAGEGSVAPNRIDVWFQQQREAVSKEVQKSDFRLENVAHLFVENAKKNGYRYVCEGRLVLANDTLTFDCTKKQRPKKVESKYGVNAMQFEFFYGEGVEDVEEEFWHLEFSTKNADTIANMPGTSVDMYDEKHVYRFMLEKGVSSTKYVLAIEEAFKQRAQKGEK